ncbi:unnamed protein product [Scytosiphon promiscuus]
MQIPVVLSLCDFCNWLQRQNSAVRQPCLTLSYSTIAFFDPLPVAADENVTDFAAALTGAVRAADTLKLASGTFFLSRIELGSKIFLNGASGATSRNVLVTGTPGIGKSVVGFYLLYLLCYEGNCCV